MSALSFINGNNLNIFLRFSLGIWLLEWNNFKGLNESLSNFYEKQMFFNLNVMNCIIKFNFIIIIIILCLLLWLLFNKRLQWLLSE